MKHHVKQLMTVASLILFMMSAVFSEEKKPLKIFILSGQSNMVGMADVSTLPAIGFDPETAYMLKDLQDKDGNPVVCEDVYIARPGGAEEDAKIEEKFGKLEVGYGGGKSVKIGPEYAFGIYMHKMLGEPLLIIKVARGGRDLIRQFRPPSAGPFPYTEQQLAQLKEKGKDVDALKAARLESTGLEYRWMIDYVKKILADPKRVYPAYDAEAGCELAGFAWLQGYNDFIGDNYPRVDPSKGKDSLKDYSEYTNLLGCFIRDIRKDLNVPNLPFVIGVFGMDGKKAVGNVVNFRKAQAATAELPDFKGNVVNVFLENFWPEELDPLQARKQEITKGKVKLEGKALEIMNHIKEIEKKLETENPNNRKSLVREERDLRKQLMEACFTPEEAKLLDVGVSNQSYHYWGSAKFYCRAGKAFAEALVNLQSGK